MFQIPFEWLNAFSPDLYFIIQLVSGAISAVLIIAGICLLVAAGLPPALADDKHEARLGLILLVCGVFYWITGLYAVPVLAVLIVAALLRGLFRAFR